MDMMINARKIVNGSPEQTYTLIFQNFRSLKGTYEDFCRVLGVKETEVEGCKKAFGVVDLSDLRAFKQNTFGSSTIKIQGKASYLTTFFDWGELG